MISKKTYVPPKITFDRDAVRNVVPAAVALVAAAGAAAAVSSALVVAASNNLTNKLAKPDYYPGIPSLYPVEDGIMAT